jgi:hypothetical protein
VISESLSVTAWERSAPPLLKPGKERQNESYEGLWHHLEHLGCSGDAADVCNLGCSDWPGSPVDPELCDWTSRDWTVMDKCVDGLLDLRNKITKPGTVIIPVSIVVEEIDNLLKEMKK